jgi:hypothetical protein
MLVLNFLRTQTVIVRAFLLLVAARTESHPPPQLPFGAEKYIIGLPIKAAGNNLFFRWIIT